MTTLGDIIQGTSAAQFLARIVSLFRLAQFPVAAWQPTALPRVLTESMASALADLSELIVAIAKGGHLSTAEEEWADLTGEEVYDETRKPAEYTRGTVVLSDPLSQGPFTLAAGEVWVSTAGRSLRFRTVADVTVPLNGQAPVLVEAEEAGDGYNVANNTITDVLTPGGTGLAVDNPADDTTGTWITRQGTNREGDDPYKTRCRQKWSILGTGSNDAAYLYRAKTASPEVTRAAVWADPDTGKVYLTIAGPVGPVSADAYNAVDSVVNANRPICDRVILTNGIAQATNVGGTIYLSPGADPVVTAAAAQRAVETYYADRELDETIYRARVIEIIMSVRGVRDLVLAAPDANLTPILPYVPVPFFTLGTVG
jgi:phage-related baseplate assembly protein